MLNGEVFFLSTDKNAIACSMFMGTVHNSDSAATEPSSTRAPIPCLLQISNYRLTFTPQLPSSISSSSRSKPRELHAVSSKLGSADALGDLPRKGKLSRSSEALRLKKEVETPKDTKEKQDALTHSSKSKEKHSTKKNHTFDPKHVVIHTIYELEASECNVTLKAFPCRKFVFSCAEPSVAASVVETLREHIHPHEDEKKLLYQTYQPDFPPSEYWQRQLLEEDFKRMRLNLNEWHRVALPDSIPNFVFLPHGGVPCNGVENAFLQEPMSFPILQFIKDGSSLFISKKVGRESLKDLPTLESYFAILKTSKFELIDVGKTKQYAQPLPINQVAWTRKFLNLAEEQEMRDAFAQLPHYHEAAQQLARDGGVMKDALTFPMVRWTSILRNLLTTANEMAQSFNDISMCLECIDGSVHYALASLIQVIADPFFRTTFGFATLVERAWTGMGYSYDEYSGSWNSTLFPISFFAFLHGVFILILQNPTAFEFNDCFLSLLVDELLGFRFTSFISKEKRHNNANSLTSISIWDFISSKKKRYTSQFYDKEAKPQLLLNLRNGPPPLWNYFTRDIDHYNFDWFTGSKAFDTNLTELNLSRQELFKLPSWIGRLTALKKLSVRHNYLQYLDLCLLKLSNLNVLDVSHNPFKGFSEGMIRAMEIHIPQLQEIILDGVNLSFCGYWGTTEKIVWNGGCVLITKGEGSNTNRDSVSGNISQLELRSNQLSTSTKALEALMELPLVHLDLGLNSLCAFPPLIPDKEVRLVALVLDHNAFTHFNFVCEIPTLEVCDMSHNKLVDIPENLPPRLKTLNLSNNKILSFPINFAMTIVDLNLSNNLLGGEMPKYLFNSVLAKLDLSMNRLVSFPEQLDPTDFSLKRLLLRKNKIEKVSHDIALLTRLVKLDISHNHITTIPLELGMMSKLKSYNFEHNPLVFCDDFPFPNGVLESRAEVETLVKYIKGKTVNLRRVRLCLLGEHHSGKTSIAALLNKLWQKKYKEATEAESDDKIDFGFALRSIEEETLKCGRGDTLASGIEIIHSRFAWSDKEKKKQLETTGTNERVTVNVCIWDFQVSSAAPTVTEPLTTSDLQESFARNRTVTPRIPFLLDIAQQNLPTPTSTSSGPNPLVALTTGSAASSASASGMKTERQMRLDSLSDTLLTKRDKIMDSARRARADTARQHVKETPRNERQGQQVKQQVKTHILHMSSRFFLTEESVYILPFDLNFSMRDSNIDYWVYSIYADNPNAVVFLVGTHYDTLSEAEKVGVEGFLIHTRSYYKALFKTMQIAIGAISCVDGYGLEKFLKRLEKLIVSQHFVSKEIALPLLLLERNLVFHRLKYFPPLLNIETLRTMSQQCCMDDNLTELRQSLRLLAHLSKGSFINYYNFDDINSTNFIVNPAYLLGLVEALLAPANRKKFILGTLPFNMLTQILPPTLFPEHIHNYLYTILKHFELVLELPNHWQGLLTAMRDKYMNSSRIKRGTKTVFNKDGTALLTITEGAHPHAPLTRTRSRDDFELDYSASSSIRESDDTGGTGSGSLMHASSTHFGSHVGHASSPSLTGTHAGSHAISHGEKERVTVIPAEKDREKETSRKHDKEREREERREEKRERELERERSKDRKDRLPDKSDKREEKDRGGEHVRTSPLSGPVGPRNTKSKSLTLSVPKLSLVSVFNKNAQEPRAGPLSPKSMSDTAPSSPSRRPSSPKGTHAHPHPHAHAHPHPAPTPTSTSAATSTTTTHRDLQINLAQLNSSDPSLASDALQRTRAGSTDIGPHKHVISNSKLESSQARDKAGHAVDKTEKAEKDRDGSPAKEPPTSTNKEAHATATTATGTTTASTTAPTATLTGSNPTSGTATPTTTATTTAQPGTKDDKRDDKKARESPTISPRIAALLHVASGDSQSSLTDSHSSKDRTATSTGASSGAADLAPTPTPTPQTSGTATPLPEKLTHVSHTQSSISTSQATVSAALAHSIQLRDKDKEHPHAIQSSITTSSASLVALPGREGDQASETSVHRESIEALCAAAFGNDIETVSRIIARPDIMEFVNMKNEKGEAPVFNGAAKGYVNVLLRLLMLGGIDVDVVVESHGGTPLHAAAEKGYFDCVCLLLAAGASPDKLNKRGNAPRQEAKGRAATAFELWETEGINAIKAKSLVTNDYMANRKGPNVNPNADPTGPQPRPGGLTASSGPIAPAKAITPPVINPVTPAPTSTTTSTITSTTATTTVSPTPKTYLGFSIYLPFGLKKSFIYNENMTILKIKDMLALYRPELDLESCNLLDCTGAVHLFESKTRLADLKEPVVYVVFKVPEYKTLDFAEAENPTEIKKSVKYLPRQPLSEAAQPFFKSKGWQMSDYQCLVANDPIPFTMFVGVLRTNVVHIKRKDGLPPLTKLSDKKGDSGDKVRAQSSDKSSDVGSGDLLAVTERDNEADKKFRTPRPKGKKGDKTPNKDAKPEHGSNPKVLFDMTPSLTSRDDPDGTKTAIVEAACKSAFDGQLDKCKEFIATHPQWINEVNAFGQTALYCAARQGHSEIMIELLNVPNINIDKPVPKHGGTPLHAATFSSRLEAVALLLYKGANYSLPNNLNLTARQEAKGDIIDVFHNFEIECRAGFKNLYPIVANLQGIKIDRLDSKKRKVSRHFQRILAVDPNGDMTDPDIKDIHSKICVHAFNGELSPLKELTKKYPKMVNCKNERGQSPLYCACKQGHSEVVLFLLNCPLIEVDDKVVSHGGTALHVAAFSSHVECLVLLLARGAMTNVLNNSNLTARQEAKGTAMDIFAIFEEEGVDGLRDRYPIVDRLQRFQKAHRSIFGTETLTMKMSAKKDDAKARIGGAKFKQTRDIMIDLNATLLYKRTNASDALFMFPPFFAWRKPFLYRDVYVLNGFQLKRIYSFDIVPPKLFARVMRRLITHFSLAAAEEIKCEFWGDGVELLLASKVVVQAEIVHIDNAINITIYGEDEARVCRTFCGIVESMESLLKDWKGLSPIIFAECYGCMKQKIPQRAEYHLADLLELFLKSNGELSCEVCNEVILLSKLVPDMALSFYDKGIYAQEDLRLGIFIGEGAFAKVYKTLLHDNVVAAKYLLSNPNIMEMFADFRKEVYACSLLSSCKQSLQLNSVILTPFILVTELMEMGDLYQLIHLSPEPVDMYWSLRVKIALDVTRGMNYLNDLNPKMVHLDLKSPNILIRSLNDREEVIAKVSDFGLSSHGDIHYSRRVGNPIWLAPEILKGQCYGTPADIYSFGVILYELFELKEYMKCEFMSDLVESVIAHQRPCYNSCVPEYEAIMTACWRGDPSDRPEWKWILDALLHLKENLTAYQKLAQLYLFRIKLFETKQENMQRKLDDLEVLVPLSPRRFATIRSLPSTVHCFDQFRGLTNGNFESFFKKTDLKLFHDHVSAILQMLFLPEGGFIVTGDDAALLQKLYWQPDGIPVGDIAGSRPKGEPEVNLKDLLTRCEAQFLVELRESVS